MTPQLRDALIEKLTAENDSLRERIATLESLLGMHVETPLALDLSGQESKLFGLLLKRDLVTKDAAMTVLYGTRPDGEEAEQKIVDVFICKMRRKLMPFGIKIETKWGQGYWMSAETKARARAMLPSEAKAA